ncbi:C40 family peptidase [Desulfosporosinus sp. OT]|uniref:C40 family peptidase n=1 Tax=Desulfosporosinus sp. OT TaxID=913865 RepID=UPI000223A8BE|nr:C40 family peptidase [Desulfosporosinus sp. OT]EGW40459.1 nlpC/P60 family protein [Desulfosporosinus sp. OT]
MQISPGLWRLSGVTLAGIFLAGSILVQPTSQSSVVQPVMKQVVLASDIASTNITPFLHQQTVQTVPNSSVNSSQPVHIQVVTARKTESARKQVSRGSSESSTIVEHALSLLGTPYVFGGTTKKGFDCSGFTQYIYRASGISLPRTSYNQFTSGVGVSKNELQLGDLVFFSTYAKGASHVGIYIGGGRFVHADNPRLGVTITDLSNSYYAARYLGARRYN